jgi:lipoate-protein ligase A
MKFPPSKWRLIIHGPARGAWNMAVDEAILEAVGKSKVLPTLRFYSWEPPCLSLGHAQPSSDVSFQALKDRGWNLVRRPTGGRAILHTDELTYAVMGHPSDPRLAGGILESYRILSRALLHALQALGIPAESNEGKVGVDTDANFQSAESGNPICFEVPSNYEITVHGKKLIGSAQARRKEEILQHGSLPLQGDLGRIVEVLNFSTEGDKDAAGKRLKDRAVTVEQALGEDISFEKSANAIADSFRQVLSLELFLSEITPNEYRRARLLDHEKYSNPGWTLRV